MASALAWAARDATLGARDSLGGSVLEPLREPQLRVASTLMSVLATIARVRGRDPACRKCRPPGAGVLRNSLEIHDPQLRELFGADRRSALSVVVDFSEEPAWIVTAKCSSPDRWCRQVHPEPYSLTTVRHLRPQIPSNDRTCPPPEPKTSQEPGFMSHVTPSISSTVRNALVEVWSVLGTHTTHKPPSADPDAPALAPPAAQESPASGQPRATPQERSGSDHHNLTPCDASITTTRRSPPSQHRATARRQAASSRSRARRHRHPRTQGTHPPAA